MGFRIWSAEDLPLAALLWGDAEVTRLIGGPFTLEQIRERLDREISSMNVHGIQYWPLVLLSSGEFVGCGGLRPYDLPEGILELGFHLRPAFWRQGLADEAARAQSLTLLGRSVRRRYLPAIIPRIKLLASCSRSSALRSRMKKLYPPTGLQHPSYILRRPTPASIAQSSC